MATNSVGDDNKMLAMIFAILITSIYQQLCMYLFTLPTGTNIRKMSPTAKVSRSQPQMCQFEIWENLFQFYEWSYWLPSGNEFDGIIFSLDFHISGLCWSFPKINFTGWISIEISMRLSDDLSQNILSDDQITHSSFKTRIRSFSFVTILEYST